MAVPRLYVKHLAGSSCSGIYAREAVLEGDTLFTCAKASLSRQVFLEFSKYLLGYFTVVLYLTEMRSTEDAAFVKLLEELTYTLPSDDILGPLLPASEHVWTYDPSTSTSNASTITRPVVPTKSVNTSTQLNTEDKVRKSASSVSADLADSELHIEFSSPITLLDNKAVGRWGEELVFGILTKEFASGFATCS